MEKEKTVARKPGKTADQERDDAVQAMADGQQAGPYYRSQKEVDAAFAKRLEAERRKWAQRAQAEAQPAPAQPQGAAGMAALSLPQMAGGAPAMAQAPAAAGALAMAPGAGPASLMQPDGLAGLALGNQPGMLQAQPAAQPGLIAQPGVAADNGFNQTVLRLLEEEADIQRVFPEFDLESFIAGDQGIQNALLSGRSLWSVFTEAYGQTVRQQAEAEALERIRSRNSTMPDVLRTGGAAGQVGLDYANMPSAQFNKLRKAYEAEMRMGKKVRP